MDEIAEKAHVGKGTLYQYFDSKEDLYFAIIEHGVAEVERQLRRDVEVGPAAPARLAAMIRTLVTYWLSHGHVVRILRSAEPRLDKTSMASLYEYRLRVLDLLRRVLEEGAAEGAFRSGDMGLVARMILGIAPSIAYDWDGRHAPDEVAEAVCNLVLRGLMQGGGGR